jgi:hypothetical protein
MVIFPKGIFFRRSALSMGVWVMSGFRGSVLLNEALA